MNDQVGKVQHYWEQETQDRLKWKMSQRLEDINSMLTNIKFPCWQTT